MIEVKNIVQSYNNNKVLNNVSLEIKENAITAIIGSNGAGKSTLLGVITRLIPYNEGQVLLDGVNLKELKSNEIAKKIGILKQFNNISLKLTIYELVSMGRFPHSKGRITELDKEIINKYLDYMNLKEIKDKYIDEVSGGQKQRAFIAMILVQDTKYIFLDEPLNNLDMKYSVDMMLILQKLVKELGKTIVIVVHDINIAASFCDYVIAMKDGYIYKEDYVDKIIDKKILDFVFDHDFCVEGINGKKVCIYHKNN